MIRTKIHSVETLQLAAAAAGNHCRRPSPGTIYCEMLEYPSLKIICFLDRNKGEVMDSAERRKKWADAGISGRGLQHTDVTVPIGCVSQCFDRLLLPAEYQKQANTRNRSFFSG